MMAQAGLSCTCAAVVEGLRSVVIVAAVNTLRQSRRPCHLQWMPTRMLSSQRDFGFKPQQSLDEIAKSTEHVTIYYARWISTGFNLLHQNVGAATLLLGHAALGHPLTMRERQLIAQTVRDCLRLVPFTGFFLVPFAQLFLPFFVCAFPEILPSTFVTKMQDTATLVRELNEKRQFAEAWHQQTTEMIAVKTAEQDAYVNFLELLQWKLLADAEFPTQEEILEFQTSSANTIQLNKMKTPQLQTMTKLLGLRPSKIAWFTTTQLRRHMTHLRREDRDHM